MKTEISDVSIDEWKPTPKSGALVKSKWRDNMNDGRFNIDPGYDELKKIQSHIRRGYPDFQIMEAFGINSETLVAIKRGKYNPIEGISLDNQSKIYKKFDKVDKKINKVFAALTMLSDNLFHDNAAMRTAFKSLVKAPSNKKTKWSDSDEEE